MDESAPFRSFVFTAFATRMQTMMHVLERVAFQRVESRLADAACHGRSRRGDGHPGRSGHPHRLGPRGGLAPAGSVRRRGWVRTDRGRVRLLNLGALRRVAGRRRRRVSLGDEVTDRLHRAD
ncbi:MAG: hypothetical protein MZV49_24945 [Rhodopseudomonas palustris]|nr:hypothetical protein [Rhodopseudomonas palustris]